MENDKKRGKLQIIAGWTFGGGFFLPILVLSFVGINSPKGIWASIVANFQLGLLLAGIGAIVGLIIGIIQAIRGKEGTPFD
ncbi:hypothetical protein U27_04724 [Candidatus Vecturithrix granuli]|uniref:Uncharacterized protein n=1 Tax=Vecturithrix granuli TaxID=1499967 RepID=A0A081BZK2_VECG1|nr:hypothetical protein U27_04724 [Candidatus Vecturithrix granuli]